ncbi:hypothetical protein K440DRAFT_641530 [Wilcoxina mikolae CBS 423.85]|nr:hypothetical protein K440DRAFT_641530 [Wilcoxina mikolae CBS 423.85]
MSGKPWRRRLERNWWTRTSKDQETHVQAILDSIRQEGFRLQSEKCQFSRVEAPFLGFMVNGSVSMAAEKIAAIAGDTEGNAQLRWTCGRIPSFRQELCKDCGATDHTSRCVPCGVR